MKTDVFVVCDPDGAPMRAFTDEGAATSWKFERKSEQPQAKYKITKIPAEGDLDGAEVVDFGRPQLRKLHVVLNKKRHPYVAYTDYRLAKRVSSNTENETRCSLILDRSVYDDE